MEYLRKVVRTNKEPDEKEVLWVDTAHPDYPVMKYYENGNWKLIRQREDGVAYIMPYGGIPYSDLSQEVKMAIASGGAQANWNQTNSASPDFIWNKPYIPTALADLTEDSNHKFVSATEKNIWNNKANVSDIPADVIKFSSQSLTDAQKTQARQNIGAEQEVFVAEYGVTSFADTINACRAGKTVIAINHVGGGEIRAYQLDSYSGDAIMGGSIHFSSPSQSAMAIYTLRLNQFGWTSDTLSWNITVDWRLDENSTNPVWNSVITQALSSKYEKPSGGIPAADIAEGVIPDVSNFVTNTVNNLVNYYLKSETYTKAEVQALIGAIQSFHYEIYASTAAVTNPQGNVLYLIGPTGSGEDRYEEYVYDVTKQNPWVKIGDTSIDLSNYVTTSDLNTALSAYTTSADLSDLLDAKQDVIDDLDDIRDGAAAGATAYQKPQYGIPESDLAGEVKAKLKETLYISSLPTSDITSTDDLDDVISRSTLLKLAEGEASALIYNQLTEYGMSESDFAQTECVITKASKIVGDRNYKCELTFVLNGYEYAITADYNTRVATVTVTAVEDVTDKADKVSGATNGHLAALDSNGNLTDSGNSASDFATSAQGAKADTAYQKPSTGIPASDLADGVIPTVPTDVVKYSQQSLTDGQMTQARTNIGAGTYSKPSGGIPASDIAAGVIPAAQVQTDWNASSGMGVLLNKPTLATVATSGSYNDLSDKPSIPTVEALTTSEIDTIWNNAS